MIQNEKYTECLEEDFLEDELLNAKLFDNKSFQYILDRELQRKLKRQDSRMLPP